MPSRRTLVGATAVIVVALAACGSYPANPTTTSTSTTTTVPLLCRARHCASSAAVQGVLAVAESGASVPLVATYRFVGAKSAPLTFVFATVPDKNVLSSFPPRAEYLYQVEADGLRYEFISNQSGYFECLAQVARLDWTCRGPIPLGDPGLGDPATVGAYDVGVDLLDYLGPPLGPDPLTTRVMNGFSLSCVSYTQGKYPNTWTWCITKEGVIGYLSGPSFLRGIELVRVAFQVPKNEFSLPAKPTKWRAFEAQKVDAFLPPGLVSIGASSTKQA
jgi:hypothetical protein